MKKILLRLFAVFSIIAMIATSASAVDLVFSAPLNSGTVWRSEVYYRGGGGGGPGNPSGLMYSPTNIILDYDFSGSTWGNGVIMDVLIDTDIGGAGYNECGVLWDLTYADYAYVRVYLY